MHVRTAAGGLQQWVQKAVLHRLCMCAGVLLERIMSCAALAGALLWGLTRLG